jgi:hypothetical protein
MTKSIAKQLDQAVANELGLVLSPFTMILRHVVGLRQLVDGFVFALVQGDYIHVDTVDTWNDANGMRAKIKKFISNPLVEERLAKRQYRRWYVRGGGELFPVQTAKTEDLKENFYFLIDDNPSHRTLTVFNEECPKLRKYSLYTQQALPFNWGVILRKPLAVPA